MIVYLLWHVSHNAVDENGSVRHRIPDDELSIFEDEGDDVKLLGVYLSRANTEERLAQGRTLPGFRNKPIFRIDAYALDQMTSGHRATSPRKRRRAGGYGPSLHLAYRFAAIPQRVYLTGDLDLDEYVHGLAG